MFFVFVLGLSPSRRGRHVQGRARPGMAIQGGARQEGRVFPDPMLPVGPSRIGRARQGRSWTQQAAQAGQEGQAQAGQAGQAGPRQCLPVLSGFRGSKYDSRGKCLTFRHRIRIRQIYEMA